MLDQLERRSTRSRGEAAPQDGPEARRAARRAAGDEHDLGRRRRAAARADGRRRPAEDDGRVHPGHQPGRARDARAGRARSTTGRARGTCRTTRRFEHYHATLLPARRGALGHAVLAARARPRPDRRARLAGAALGPGLERQSGRRARRSGRRRSTGRPRERSARAPTIRSASRRRTRWRTGSNVRLEAWKAEAAGRPAHARLPAAARATTDVSLLQEPGIEGWDDWTVPTSLRKVETAVPLRLRPNGDPGCDGRLGVARALGADPLAEGR